jgi:hypothetical protein
MDWMGFFIENFKNLCRAFPLVVHQRNSKDFAKMVPPYRLLSKSSTWRPVRPKHYVGGHTHLLGFRECVLHCKLHHASYFYQNCAWAYHCFIIEFRFSYLLSRGLNVSISPLQAEISCIGGMCCLLACTPRMERKYSTAHNMEIYTATPWFTQEQVAWKRMMHHFIRVSIQVMFELIFESNLPLNALPCHYQGLSSEQEHCWYDSKLKNHRRKN